MSSSCPATFQVDSAAFDALTECIAQGDFDTCEQVPAGDEDGFLVNPLGGLAFDMAGPAGYVWVEHHSNKLFYVENISLLHCQPS